MQKPPVSLSFAHFFGWLPDYNTSEAIFMNLKVLEIQQFLFLVPH